MYTADEDWQRMMDYRDEKMRKVCRREPAVKEDLLKKVTFDELRKYIPEDEVDDVELSTVIHRVRKIVRNG